MEQIESPHQTDILSSQLENIQQQEATKGQRFLNWLIDNLLMRFGLSYLTGTIVGYFLANLFPEFTARLFYEENSIDLILVAYAIGLFNYIVYYTICETAFKGYTLGKLITGTRAVRADGEPLRFKDAILRTLCRLIPFEVFSGFGDRPWHDSMTDTMVIKTR